MPLSRTSTFGGSDVKKQCLKLYASAHNSRAEFYDRQIHELHALADQPGSFANPAKGNFAGQFTARLNAVQQAKNMSPEILEAWFEADAKTFRQFDANGNGFLEQGEFLAAVKQQLQAETLGYQDKDMLNAFAKWDIDANGSIGPYEWCVVFAVYRAEFELRKQELLTDLVKEKAANMIPCGCGIPGIFVCACWGTFCCLCTGCTSFCCYACFLRKFQSNIEDAERNTNYAGDISDCNEKAVANAKKSALKILAEGPMGMTVHVETAQETVQLLQKAPGQVDSEQV